MIIPNRELHLNLLPERIGAWGEDQKPAPSLSHARQAIFFRDLGEVIEVVKEHIAHVRHSGIDISWHGQVYK